MKLTGTVYKIEKVFSIAGHPMAAYTISFSTAESGKKSETVRILGSTQDFKLDQSVDIVIK